MRVTLRKYITNFHYIGPGPNDVLLSKDIDMPGMPFIGLTIRVKEDVLEMVEGVLFNSITGETFACIGGERASDTEIEALVQANLDNGWEIREKKE